MMRRSLYLYLAILCFLGVIAILVFSGYMGVFDTIRVTAGESEQVLTPEQLEGRNGREPFYSPGVTWGGKILFTYEVVNRRFNTYNVKVQASVWKEREKIADLASLEETLEPFGKTSLDWALDSEMLKSKGFTEGQYTVRIERDGVESSILASFFAVQRRVPVR